uniref:Uncharacterized protein n=1 Tax=Timema monikensis TaxID=170555 RepID=A0A7R9E385_9NEOP|nr:unnamed protein product [Timema monikensis]
MADQDFIVRSLKEKLAETQNELNQLKDKSDAYSTRRKLEPHTPLEVTKGSENGMRKVSELNDAGKKQHECERRVQELHNNLEECRKYMRLSLFRLTHDAAAEKNKQTEEWLIDAEEFRQKAEEGQATFNNLKAETDYLLHNLKSREKQVDNLENMIYSLKDIVVKSQTELSQVQVNATQYLKDKEAAERAQAQYRESIHLMKEALHLGQRQKDISLEKIMSISQEEVELNKPISLDLDSYTKVFEHNTAPDDTKEEMNKILESIKLKDKQTNMEQEYEAKINKLQKELIESKKQIENLQKVEKKQESKLLDPQSVEIIYENRIDALSRATLELSHMELMLHQREQEKIPPTLAEEDDKLFILESQLKAAKKEISEHIGKVEALQSEVTLSSNEQEMMFNNMFSTLQSLDKQERRLSLQRREQTDSQKVVSLQSSVNKLKREMVKYQDMITTLEEKEQLPVSQSMDIRQALLQRKLEAQDRQDRIRNEIIRDGLKVKPLKETLERKGLMWLGHVMRVLEKALENKEKGRRPSLGRPQTRWMDQVQKDVGVKGADRRCVAEGERSTGMEEDVQDNQQKRKRSNHTLLPLDKEIEAQGQMIQSYKDALKQTQQEFQELIKDADLTKQLEIQTLKSEGERKVEELQTVLKEVQLDLVKLQSLEQSINTQDEMIRVLQGSMQRAKDEYEDIIRTKKNHQVSTDETKHLNQQRIRELEDKLNETKEKLLSNQAQIEMLEREKSLPKSHSVQLQNTLLMSELEASERKCRVEGWKVMGLCQACPHGNNPYLDGTRGPFFPGDILLPVILLEWLFMAAPGQRPDGLPRKAAKSQSRYLNGSEWEGVGPSTPPHTRHSLSGASQVVFVPQRSVSWTLTWQEDRLTMEQLKFEEQYKIQGLQETLEKAHKQLEEQEIKASSEAKEKEFEQRINELNNELTVANKKMNTYQAQIKAFEEKEVPVKSQSLEMLNALLTSKLETSEKKGKYVTFEDAQQMDDYKMQTLQEVSSKIQRQLKEQSHLPEATSSQLHNAHLVSQLETYDKQVRDNVMTESWQETEETIQELESSLLKVQDELTKYKELGEVIEKEGAIPDNRSFEILDILLASKLHTAEAQVFMDKYMRDACEEVIGVHLDKVNVKVLLYADDVLMGEKESDSQNALNRLSVATDRMDLPINVSKTKDRRPSLEEKQIQDENIVLQLQTQLKDIQQELHKTNLNQENEEVTPHPLQYTHRSFNPLHIQESKWSTETIQRQPPMCLKAIPVDAAGDNFFQGLDMLLLRCPWLFPDLECWLSCLDRRKQYNLKKHLPFKVLPNVTTHCIALLPLASLVTSDKKASLEKIEKEHNQKIEALQLLLQEEQANVHTYKKQIEMLEKKEMLPKSQSADLQVALLTSKLRNVEKQEWRIVVEENQRVNNQKIQQLQDNLSQMRAELESSQDMIQTLEEQKLPQLLKSESLINQNTLLLSKLECCENQLSLKNQDIQKLIYSLKSVQTELTQLQNIHKECGNATLAIKQLNAAQDEVQALKAKITTFEAQEETRKQEDKSEEILSLHSQLATATSNLETREGVLSLKNQDIQKLIYSLKSVQTELTQLQNIHQECGNATLAIKQLNAAQDEVQALKAKITTFEAQVKEREQIDEEHKKLKYEYDGQQAQLLGLQEVLLATKQQLQDMQGKGYETLRSISGHPDRNTLGLTTPLLTAFEDPQRLHTCGDVLLVIVLRSDDTILDR